MTPKELYPIGTQLITRRLSQAALYIDIIYMGCPWLCDLKIKNNEGKWINVNEQLNCDESVYTIVQVLSKYFFNDGACVTVTAENQKWLSPVPMVGDLVWIENMGMAFEIGAIADNVVFKSAHKSPFADTESGHFVSNFYCSIEENPQTISRIYPNGQRAPLIEFDEVILPTTGEQL